MAEAHVLLKQFADIFRDNDPRLWGDVGCACNWIFIIVAWPRQEGVKFLSRCVESLAHNLPSGI